MAHLTHRALLLLLLASLLSSTGCKSKSGDEESPESGVDDISTEEATVERLQGSWAIDLEPTLATATDLGDREKLVAREMLSNLRLSIHGTDGSVKTRILGAEESQEWELSITDVDGETFKLCVTHGGSDEQECNSAQWGDGGFRVETPDGLITFYVPAEEEPEDTASGDSESPEAEPGSTDMNGEAIDPASE